MTTMKARATDWLEETWRELRNGVGAHGSRLEYMAGAIDVLADLRILTRAEQDEWIARRRRCPGHDDEDGRRWCAFGCELPSVAAHETAP